ncbi:glutamate--tRNA ligase [Candidatus Margulisiibacteriota bacterium]
MFFSKNRSIRVRFAPSPTGFLHIGSARTAFFNWLFAKANKGTFILRIEDTDYERSMEGYVSDIIDGLQWLGLDWDEGPKKDGNSKGKYGPYRQSRRLDIYKKYVQEMVSKGHVYKCYCSDEELGEKRQEALSKGRAPKYDGACRNLSDADQKKLGSEGRKYVYRFKMPTETIYVEDLVRGKVKFDCSLIGDFVIIKSNGTPSYNFAAVIDDYLMKISHVIRGEDHLSNTPRQMMLYRALGFEYPKFAHLPIILGNDRSKLSKRHGALSVLEYKKEGYLPGAVVNFLALLGWSPKNDKEIMSKKELINNFSLSGISKSGSIFDVVKLKWMNAEYLKKYSSKELIEAIKPDLLKAGYDIDMSNKWFEEMIDTVRDGLSINSDIVPISRIFFEKEPNKAEVEKIANGADALKILEAFEAKIGAIKDISHDKINDMLDEMIKEGKLKKGAAFKTLRTVLTGSPSGPELWRIIRLFGKEKVLDRIKMAKELRAA